MVMDKCATDLHWLTHGQPLGHLPEAVVRFYAAQLVVALGEIHACGLAHRDLKPENILLDFEGNVRLADFGVAAKLKVEGKGRTKVRAGVCLTQYLLACKWSTFLAAPHLT